jgi:hypothetical protein
MNRLEVIASLMLAIFITSVAISIEAAARGRTSHRYGGLYQPRERKPLLRRVLSIL